MMHPKKYLYNENRCYFKTSAFAPKMSQAYLIYRYRMLAPLHLVSILTLTLLVKEKLTLLIFLKKKT